MLYLLNRVFLWEIFWSIILKTFNPIFNSIKFLIGSLHLLNQDGISFCWILISLDSTESFTATLWNCMAKDRLPVHLSQWIQSLWFDRTLTQPRNVFAKLACRFILSKYCILNFHVVSCSFELLSMFLNIWIISRAVIFYCTLSSR